MIVLSMDLGLDGQNGLNVQQKNVELVINGERECVWVQWTAEKDVLVLKVRPDNVKVLVLSIGQPGVIVAPHVALE